LLAARAIERAEGEVEKDERHSHVDQKARMISAGVPCVSQFVCILRKEQTEEREKESRDLEPQNAPGVSEGSPDRLTEIFCAGGDRPTPLGSASGISRRLLLHGRPFLLHGMSGLRSAVTHHPRSDTDADAQFSAKTIRLHTQKCSSGL